VKFGSGPGSQMESIVRNHHRLVGWNYVNVIGFDFGIALYLMYRHARAISEQFRENADLIRIEVLNNRKCHAGVDRQCTQKIDERFQATRRSAYPDESYAFGLEA
jgi:hypothetical protein